MRTCVSLVIAALALLPARVQAGSGASGDTFVPVMLPPPAVAAPDAKKRGPDSPPIEELHPSPAQAAGRVRVIEAYAEQEEPLEVARGTEPPNDRDDPKRIRIAPRLGASVPRMELSTGILAGAEASYLLPLLSDRLRASFGAAWSFTSRKGPRLDPGRGFDPAAIQSSTLIPLELMVSWSPLKPGGPFELAIGAGYGLYVIRTDVSMLGSSAGETAAGSALVLALRGGYRIGPGVLLAEVRHAEVAASFERLPATTQTTFSGTALTVGYGIDL